ncbi:sugar ABC transporter permease [Nordella sp. HKS 07]|uniref:carbohydrate ABC transporter permease n=1 Tax=Nordella sp. HKS 07 TaxID=2712222 RepID=UPI0013E10B48|nr:sugar ABC transporter permease [Nordella sp. HKS 07]QIG49986.1 sugar ABC transporter permease [Nordella sp. HKS 07]
MSAAAATQTKAGRPFWAGRRGAGLLFVGPAVFVMLLVGLFPFLWSVVVSFQDITGSNPNGDWVGLANYKKLVADTRVWAALGRTLLLLAVALPLELILGMLLALHFQAERPFKRLFVALLVLPAVVSPMVAGSMWRLMFDHKFGPFNQIIGWIAGEPIVLLWTVKPHLAYWAILIAEVWQWTPFMFIILLAALANVEREQLEAAEIDGAGRFRVFFRIVLPAIMPVLSIAVLLRALDLFRIFDAVWQLTRGGPGTKTETLSIFMFIRGFQSFETSYTAALVVVLLILLSATVVFALKRMEIAR